MAITYGRTFIAIKRSLFADQAVNKEVTTKYPYVPSAYNEGSEGIKLSLSVKASYNVITL